MNSQDCGLDNETFCGGTPDDEPTREELLEKALADLLAWAHEANSHLRYDNSGEFQLGGNPHCNQIFKAAHALLAKPEEESPCPMM